MTDNKLEQIKGMWAKGMSVTQIGVALGTSRNAVSGFINRNRDPFDRRKDPAAPRAKVEPKTPKRTGRPPALARIPKFRAESETGIQDSEIPNTSSDIRTLEAVPDTPTKRFIDLARSCECKFIMTSFQAACGPESPVCGRPAAIGEPYCTPHMRLTNNPPPRRTGTKRAYR